VFNALKVSVWGSLAALLLISFSSYSSTLYKYGSTYYPSGEVACDTIEQTADPSGCNGGVCNYTFTPNECKYYDSTLTLRTGANLTLLNGDCSLITSDSYIDDGTGTCIMGSICNQGQTEVLEVRLDSNKTTVNISDGSIFPIVNEGCVYTLTDPFVNDSCVAFDNPDNPNGPPTFVCTSSYTQTGESYTGDLNETIQAVNSVDFTEHVEQPASSSQTPSPPTTDILPDGTTVTTEAINKTIEGASSTDISETETDIVVTHKTGSETVTNETTVTTENPDNTVVVSKETQNTYTPPEITNLNIDKNTGKGTSSTSQSSPQNSGSTVTSTFDANGNHTGTTTTGAGDGTGTDDSTKEGNCGAPGQPPCDVTIEDTTEDSHTQGFKDTEAELKAKRDGVLAELANHNEDFGLGGVSEFSSSNFITNYLPLPNVTTCSGEINTTIFGYSFILAPCDDLAPLREILAWVFFVLTVFSVINITLGRKIV